MSNKFDDIHVSPKVYWPILKIFLNNTKTPIIPSFFYGNRFVTDFTKQADLINSFFDKQCTVTGLEPTTT